MKTKPTKAQISLVMRELGRRGGLIGGLARKRALTPERRSAIARHAALVRHGKLPRC